VVAAPPATLVQQSPPQPVYIQANLAPPTSQQPKVLLFSSQSVSKLRPLLHMGMQPPSAEKLPFPPPLSSLSSLFTLKQSSTLPSDMLLSGARSVALMFVTEKDMQKEEQRKRLEQKSASAAE
jgi:hypothetical protein